MRVLSLFSGIGGFDLGLERAGMEIVGQVEIDPYCQKVLAKHWPNVKRMRDIHDVRGDEFGAVDLIARGFPCQPVSVAGKRKAQNDARWLWPQFARLIRAIRPQYLLVENVPGLLDGAVSEVLGDLAESGYDAEWDCLPAAAFGAPHERDRFWMVAYPRGKRVQRFFTGAIPRQSAFSWCQDVRGVEALRKRSDLPPSLFRGACDGIPDWVDRTRALGNAVVPQIVTWIGERIMAVDV